MTATTGLRRRPQFIDLLTEILVDPHKIKYPNRDAKQERNGFVYSQFDEESNRLMMDQQTNVNMQMYKDLMKRMATASVQHFNIGEDDDYESVSSGPSPMPNVQQGFGPSPPAPTAAATAASAAASAAATISAGISAAASAAAAAFHGTPNPTGPPTSFGPPGNANPFAGLVPDPNTPPIFMTEGVTTHLPMNIEEVGAVDPQQEEMAQAIAATEQAMHMAFQQQQQQHQAEMAQAIPLLSLGLPAPPPQPFPTPFLPVSPPQAPKANAQPKQAAAPPPKPKQTASASSGKAPVGVKKELGKKEKPGTQHGTTIEKHTKEQREKKPKGYIVDQLDARKVRLTPTEKRKMTKSNLLEKLFAYDKL